MNKLKKSRRKSIKKSRKYIKSIRRKSRRKSKRKSRRKSRRIYDAGGSWETILKKHMKEKGFKLVRKSKHCVWEDEHGRKIITSCTPKPSQYENIKREIDRDIKKLDKK